MTTDGSTPSGGTSTFLFSDIEGSTRIEERLGTAAYAELRERHRALLRAAFEAGHGQEQGTQGDSFFVTFGSARAAVAAAVAAQRALREEPWPDEGEIRVRIGIHTGESVEAGGSLVGLDINRAARIAAAGHGGQILLSDATRALVAESLPSDVRLRELGEFRLRDLTTPERLSQVEADGLPTAFPPPRTPDTRLTNLPAQLTTFVGREEELAEAASLLDRTRLLTLTGPGGTGKTRMSIALATAVSDRFPDGVYFVALEPVRDPMLVASRIAAAVGVAEIGSRPVLELVIEWLGERRVLLVLDNWEQVIDAAPMAAELLRAAPGLKIIATSRAALRISGEQDYPVPGLPTPPDPSELSSLERMSLPGGARSLDAAAVAQYASVRLFIERAVAVRPGFTVTNENAPAVAAISARLHGMPLAIELAAARVKLLSPEAILARLEHQLDVLAIGGRDLPARQQTLRGAIAWSYDLLDDGARRLLDRASVFAGSFDLETAEAVCGPGAEVGGDVADGLMGLADQSLIRIQETAAGDIRFILLETIREFAQERLGERGEADVIARRHRDWYHALVERAAPELAGEEQRRWLDRLELEHDDIRAALDTAVGEPDPAVAIGVGFALWRFWQKHGHLAEARRRLEAIAETKWSREDPRLRARLMEALGGVCWWQADLARMRECYAEALVLWLEIGDRTEIANAYYNASFGYGMWNQAGGVPDPVDSAIGLDYATRALEMYRAIGDIRGAANAEWGIGNYHYFNRSPGFGSEQFRAALAAFRQTDDRTMEAWSLHMLGSALLRMGRIDEAREHIGHAIRHFDAAGDAAGLTLTLYDMAAITVRDGDLPRAARLRGAAHNLSSETGANLATFIEEIFEKGIRPSVTSKMTAEDIERYGAEGAAMTMEEAVAYALEGAPVGPDDDHAA